MKNNISGSSIFNDVSVNLESLYSAVKQCEEALLSSASQHLKDKNLELITAQIKTAQKVSTFTATVKQLTKEWRHLSTDILQKLDSSIKIGGIDERTDWIVRDGVVKIETKRHEGNPYSNIIPIPLFERIASVAFGIALNQKFVKTTSVLDLLEEDIITQSEYKKTPRTLVYSTFLVLQKEQVLKKDDQNSHKYVPAVSEEGFNQWLNNIGNNTGVSTGEKEEIAL